MKAPVVLDEEEKNVKCWAELLYDFSEMEMFSYSVQKKLCIYVFIQWKHLFWWAHNWCDWKSIRILLELLRFNGYKINLIQLNITDQEEETLTY